MRNIVKVCKKHGELNESQTRKDGKYLRCLQCKAEKDKRFYEKNPARHIKRVSENKKNNRDKINEWTRSDRRKDPSKYSRWYKTTYDNNKDKIQKRNILRNHGITLEEYEAMFLKQNSLCAICLLPETRKGRTPGTILRLCVDHCHKTGTIRGLLCHACNTAIGKFKDSTELLMKAIEYLKKEII
jgi:Recombination endonuclease VII